MKMAFVGWGSLIRNSRGLKVAGEWQEDGPLLPIEFARISKGKRLTLVLCPDASNVQTLWAYTAFKELKKAIMALANRERTKEDNIGFFSTQDGSSRSEAVPEVLPRIVDWAKLKQLDAVIWTDLTSDFKEETNADLNEDNVLSYISDLTPEERTEAENYVCNAPEQIDTKIRQRLKTEFGWRTLTEYRNGFWLDNNTFITADGAHIQTAERKVHGNPYGKIEKAQMLILTNAVEMIVDKGGKILGLEKRQKFGLWLDVVNRVMRERELAEPSILP